MAKGVAKGVTLPSPSVTVGVSALPTGQLYLPDRWLFEDGDKDMYNVKQLSPDFSFLISHPSRGHLLFDLGMRKVGIRSSRQ